MRILILASTFGLSSAARAQPDTDLWLAPLSRSGDQLVAGEPRNLTARPGYDNQPQFSKDGGAILFAAIHSDQSDVYRYDIASGLTTQVTHTPESEYSPTPSRDGSGITVVRVEADSTQRVWQFAPDGGQPTLLLPEAVPIGYFAWAFDHTLALFVLGDPPTLQIADTESGSRQVVAKDIGRSLQKIPLQRAVSFVQRSDSATTLDRYDVSNQVVETITELPEGAQDHAWMPDGTTVLASAGTTIFAWEPAGAEWRKVIDFSASGVKRITRMAVSPEGDLLAFAAE